jgi:hypothetical protein
MNETSDLDRFVAAELDKHDLKLVQITEELMVSRLSDIMQFVNAIRTEYSSKYGWSIENKEYFLNPMDRKFSYSYLIENKNRKILILSLFSVYTKTIHNHCTYSDKEYRNLGLAKLLLMNLCTKAIKDGLETYSGFFPKGNNGSLILFLKLGLRIDYMRNNSEIFGTCNLKEMANNAYKLYCKEKKINCDEGDSDKLFIREL